jgi:hypothetical protein
MIPEPLNSTIVREKIEESQQEIKGEKSRARFAGALCLQLDTATEIGTNRPMLQLAGLRQRIDHDLSPTTSDRPPLHGTSMKNPTPMEPQSAAPKQSVEMQGFLQRLYYALGPLAAGIILDVLDLATFGPIGIVVGALVGGYAGWILGECEGFDHSIRIAFAICAAAYMTIPFTEPIPAATILILTARFFAGPPARPIPPPSTDSTDEANTTQR